MLGIDTTHPHVTGRYATEMRAAAVRVHTGKLNASDKKILERVWESGNAPWKKWE